MAHVKYVFVFNPHAKRYSPDAEARILAQAATLLPQATLAVTYTTAVAQQPSSPYGIPDFVQWSADADCVVAVGGDGTVNLVVSALMQSGLASRVRLGVIPYGTGNNLVRSLGLNRDSATALQIIRQGHTIPLDVAWINRQAYGFNASVGLFPSLVAQRVTRSLVGWVYETLRHLRFTPWPLRLRYTDAMGHEVTLPTRRYIVGTVLNTAYYGSFLHMAPGAVGDDGLFDVALIHATPILAYPLVLLMLWTGRYALSRHTTTFRARRVEVLPEAPCHCETDGELVPHASRYTIEMAGQLRVLVPAWSASRAVA